MKESSERGKFPLPAVSLLLAVVFGLAAALMVWFVLAAARPAVPVVVARKDMQVGHVIAMQDIVVRKLPPAAVPGDAVRSPREALGATVFSGPVLEGDVLRKRHLSGEGSLVASLQSIAPKGWVAVQIPEGSGNGLLGIRRGDLVDVYAEAPAPAGQSGARAVMPVVKGAIVLLTPFQEGAKTYVLAVPPESAQALAEVEVYGRKTSLVVVPFGGLQR